uniref:Ras-GEF domain-containing protein n=1 Tax=Knipowitschia caucasica TaxID=637954 RepID=A0AAV2JLC9_KNICA
MIDGRLCVTASPWQQFLLVNKHSVQKQIIEHSRPLHGNKESPLGLRVCHRDPLSAQRYRPQRPFVSSKVQASETLCQLKGTGLRDPLSAQRYRPQRPFVSSKVQASETLCLRQQEQQKVKQQEHEEVQQVKQEVVKQQEQEEGKEQVKQQEEVKEQEEVKLQEKVVPVDSRGEALLSALHCPTHSPSPQDRGSQLSLLEEDDLLHCSTEDLSKRWRVSRAVEPSSSFSIAAALPVPCYSSLMEDMSSSCVHSEEPFCQSHCSSLLLAQQLTLIEQEIFQRCHPVHFLNSRTQGVTDHALSTNKNVCCAVCPAEGSGALCSDHSSLQGLLVHSERVSQWVCAEVLLCDSVKAQVALLTKYLWIGKHCYESRNFATAMQILRGLENVIVRQLPAWKHLPTKVCEVLEELRAVQVFLKSDDLCLMGGERLRRRPTLPSAHILALHVQQLEIGAFKLTTGAFKWNKLRRIAKVVSQVHAFQEALFPYSPDRDLQSYLRVRITRTGSADIQQLASGSQANFQQTTERQARRIHDTLRRVKASFQ